MRRLTLQRLVGTLLLVGVVGACDRDSVIPQLERPARRETEEDRLKDSVYVHTHGLYLWQDDLPDWFGNIRAHTRRYNSADAVLEELKSYARDASGRPYDRFSFLDRWGTVQAEVMEGLWGSFGFDVRYENDTALYVKMVDLNSPAYRRGIRRGWQVIQINGRSDLSLSSLEQDNFSFLFDALDGQQIDLTLQQPDGQRVSLTLSREEYRVHPIVIDTVYVVGDKPVGYFAFNSFISTLNEYGQPTYVKLQLDQLFARFESAGVRELIVDLRYNGGGAVVTAEYLSNLLVPVSAGNRLMYTAKVNDNLDRFLQRYRVRMDFSPVYFNKMNTLDLERIYFLVTAGTASASELLINNLRPYTDVKLIGEHTTYGKPVGYFNWDVLGVDLYAVSFQMFNAEGYGEYFDGLSVDHVVYDDLTKDFGDPREAMTAEALHYSLVGEFSRSVNTRGANVPFHDHTMARLSDRLLDVRGNKGMYLFRR